MDTRRQSERTHTILRHVLVEHLCDKGGLADVAPVPDLWERRLFDIGVRTRRVRVLAPRVTRQHDHLVHTTGDGINLVTLLCLREFVRAYAQVLSCQSGASSDIQIKRRD